ncbi:MAG: hypothetical protein QW063_02215 [Candidatus Nanoarchaeia archaeon]
MAMVKNIYDIIDEAKEHKIAIHEAAKTKKDRISIGEIAGWNEKILQLQIDTAEKLNEFVERLVRLEDEVRKKVRPEMPRKAK